MEGNVMLDGLGISEADFKKLESMLRAKTSGAGLEMSLAMVAKAMEAGVAPYDMCVAAELVAALRKHKSALSRRKNALRKINEDVNDLFDVAREVFVMSAGAATPGDAARGTASCYMKCGMNVEKTLEMARNSEFALYGKEEE